MRKQIIIIKFFPLEFFKKKKKNEFCIFLKEFQRAKENLFSLLENNEKNRIN